MKIVKVKGCGKWNKIVESELNKAMEAQAEADFQWLKRKLWGRIPKDNPDEKAFAE